MNSTQVKKILIVLYYYHPYVSGLSNYAKELAESLVRKGYAVTVLTTRYDKKFPKESVINSVRVIRYPVIARMGKGVIAPFFWWKIIELSKKHDIVNFHLPMADAGLAALFINKAKIVTTYHCDLNLGGGILNTIIQKISNLLMKMTLRCSKNIVVNSLDYFSSSRMMKFTYKAVEIYPPIPFEQYGQVNSEQLSIKLKLKPQCVKIGFAGRLVREKGIEYLLRAIPYLKREFDHFVLLIAGEDKKIAGGSIKDELQEYLALYPENVVFTGFLEQKELQQFYTMVDVLVLPSVDPLESFGMVQIEAMLCGTPVVASNMPGVRTPILETGFGALAEPRNPIDIAAKIHEVVKRKMKFNRDQMKKFSSTTSLQKYEAVFTSFSSPHA